MKKLLLICTLIAACGSKGGDSAPASTPNIYRIWTANCTNWGPIDMTLGTPTTAFIYKFNNGGGCQCACNGDFTLGNSSYKISGCAYVPGTGSNCAVSNDPTSPNGCASWNDQGTWGFTSDGHFQMIGSLPYNHESCLLFH